MINGGEEAEGQQFQMFFFPLMKHLQGFFMDTRGKKKKKVRPFLFLVL